MKTELINWAKQHMRPGTTQLEVSYNNALLDLINHLGSVGAQTPATAPAPAPAASDSVKDPMRIRNSEAPPWHPFSRLPRGIVEQVSAMLVTTTAACLEQEFGVPATTLPVIEQKALFDQFGVRTVAFMDPTRNLGSMALYHDFAGWPRLFGMFEVNLASGEARGLHLPEGLWPNPPKNQGS